MKNRFKERKGHFVKGKGWVCKEEENGQSGNYPYSELAKYKNNGADSIKPGDIQAMEFSRTPMKEKAPPRVTSRFKSMKQPHTRAPRITIPSPRLKW